MVRSLLTDDVVFTPIISGPHTLMSAAPGPGLQSEDKIFSQLKYFSTIKILREKVCL